MKRTNLLSVLLMTVALFVTSCDKKNVIQTTLPKELKGQMAYIYDFETEKAVDSLIVDKLEFEIPFTPTEKAHLLLFRVGEKSKLFVAEKGTLRYNYEEETIVGSPLNQSLTDFTIAIKALEEKDTVEDSEYFALSKEFFLKHKDNQLGAVGLIYCIRSSEDLDQIKELLDQADPDIIAIPHIKATKDALENLEKTLPGKTFVDFTGIDKEGKAVSLSEYLGQGQYVLIDFWASWCGPCRREIPYLKDVYEKYRTKGLAILGINVWERNIEDHFKAVEELGITWPQIIDKENVATNLYGVLGIPQIMLVGPDGVIIARNLNHEAIESAVAPLYQ